MIHQHLAFCSNVSQRLSSQWHLPTSEVRDDSVRYQLHLKRQNVINTSLYEYYFQASTIITIMFLIKFSPILNFNYFIALMCLLDKSALQSSFQKGNSAGSVSCSILIIKVSKETPSLRRMMYH